MKKVRIKKTTKQYLIVALICMIVIGGTAILAYITMINQMKQKYDSMYAMAQQELEDNQRVVYVAKENIALGDCVTTDNTEYIKVYATQPQETYLTKDDIGKALIVDVKAGTQILSSMVTENIVDSDIREVSYETIIVNSNIVHNDTVDIRILYPNGENFVVLPKKLIKNVGEGIESFYWLTEEEIVRMSSAIVDAYLYTGTILYTTKYIEPNLQEASIVTYTPSLATLDMIKENPNIVEIASEYLSETVRKQLENRLAESTKVDVGEIDWKVNNNKINSTKNNADDTTVKTDEDGFVYFTEEEVAKEEDPEYGE